MLTPQQIHEKLAAQNKPAHSYKGGDFSVWQEQARQELKRLLCLPLIMPDDDAFTALYEKSCGDFIEKGYRFISEKHTEIHIRLLLPAKTEKPLPAMICLQGHSTGMHMSFRETRFPEFDEPHADDEDFALQAVKNGYAAVCIDQRCFGERGQRENGRPDCHQASMTALMLGRTMIGERVWDVSRLIDIIEKYIPQIDAQNISIMGLSGGGTISFYASCLDERIKSAIVSGAFCTFEHSILSIGHCDCNYIPGILKSFHMEDMAGLIAPRPLLIVSGVKDTIFLIEGVRIAYEEAKRLYTSANAADKVMLTEGDDGHRFYAEKAWSAYLSLRS